MRFESGFSSDLPRAAGAKARRHQVTGCQQCWASPDHDFQPHALAENCRTACQTRRLCGLRCKTQTSSLLGRAHAPQQGCRGLSCSKYSPCLQGLPCAGNAIVTTRVGKHSKSEGHLAGGVRAYLHSRGSAARRSHHHVPGIHLFRLCQRPASVPMSLHG